MQTTTQEVFIADDGKVFTNKGECEHYEAEYKRLEAATHYWQVIHSPDLTEGRGMFGLSLFKFVYFGRFAEEHMQDFCHKRYGPRVEYVQGASEIMNWSLRKIDKAQYERQGQEARVGDSRSVAKYYELAFDATSRLAVKE